MSETYTRKQVRCVSVAPVVAGGAVMAITLGAALLKSLSKTAQKAYQSYSTGPLANPLQMKSKVSLSEQEPLQTSSLLSLSPIEKIKVSTLAALNNSGCLVEDTGLLMQKMRDLQSANNTLDVCKAQHALYSEMEKNHDQLFIKGLSIACEKASVKAGFASIETRKSLNDGTVRIIATDNYGRSIVSELSCQNDQKQIVSEIIGVRDGSCKVIVNRFDEALKEEGIISLPPDRKFTGGVCETNAALEFMRRIVKRQQTDIPVQKRKEIQYRRLRSLNQKTIIKNQ